MDNIVRTILLEWLERPLPKPLKREQKITFPKIPRVNKAQVVTGFRRVGKTYLLYDYIRFLLSKLSRKEVVYINFEDERILPKTETVSQLIPQIQTVFGRKPAYLFLDELQNIPNWSKWLRRILDQEDIKIVVTGSSSKMSSFEMPTELRGRFWETKVYPLTFKEFLRFKEEEINYAKISYLPNQHARFDYLFEEYLLYGGLPEVVLTPVEKKLELLQNYFHTVVRKDIIERFNIRNETALHTLLKLLLNSTYITVSKLYNSLKSLGLSVGKTTVNEYLSHIESAYFAKQLFFYSPSMRNRLQYPRKLYIIDNGFLTALSTKFSKNYGRLFENLVFWQLEKKDKDLYYYQNVRKDEVGFVAMQDGKAKILYQACYDLSDIETKEREIKFLTRAGKRLHCKNLHLIVGRINGQERQLEKEGIKLIPSYRIF